MRRMRRRWPQTIEREGVHAAQKRDGRVGNAVRIRNVRERSDAVSEDCPVAVADGERRDVDAFESKWAVDLVQIELRLSAADLRVVPDVAERAADRLGSRRVREGMDRLTLPEIERPDVVESHQVIGMRMGVDHEVETRDRIPNNLRPETQRRIDLKIFS